MNVKSNHSFFRKTFHAIILIWLAEILDFMLFTSANLYKYNVCITISLGETQYLILTVKQLKHVNLTLHY